MAIILTNQTIHGNIHEEADKIIKQFNTNDCMIDQECLLALMFSNYIPIYVPKIYNLHKDEGNVLLTMEKITGKTFREFLKDKHNISIKYKVVMQMLDSLQLIHKLGYCHKDLHDENIIITDNYDVKIIDFGCTQKITEDGIYDDYMYMYTHISHLLFEIDASMEDILYVTDNLGPEDVVCNEDEYNTDLSCLLYNILENIYIDNNL